MFSTLLSASLVFAAAIQGASADFAINTPQLVQCETAHVSWAKAVAPYNLAVVHSNDPCGDILLDLGDHNGTTMSWTVNLPAGTEVQFSLLDNGVDEAWSGNMTVQAGSDSSCLSGNSTGSASSGASPSASIAPASGTTLVVSGSQPSASSDSSAVPVGAANAGELGNSGALSSVHLSRPTIVLGSAVAIFAAMLL